MERMDGTFVQMTNTLEELVLSKETLSHSDFTIYVCSLKAEVKFIVR